MTDREKLIEILRVPIYPHELADPTEVVADYLLDNGVTFATDNNDGDKWIPVTERLPDTFGEYIVAVKALDGTFYVDYADYDRFQQRWTTGLYRSPKEEVTHWMPLPEPPKGVE